MRVIHATLSIGLANVPVGVASSVSETEKIKFKTLHDKCLTPVKQPRMCPTCNTEAVDTVKAFEVNKGQFVTFTQEEIDSVSAERSGVIQITKMVGEDPPAFNEQRANHWLVPSVMFGGHYAVFWEAMMEGQLMGVGTHSLWGTERACMVVAETTGLRLVSLLSRRETVPADFTMPSVPTEALGMAETILGALRGKLEASDFETDEHERMTAMITARAAGGEIVIPEALPEPVATVDLMQSLREALAASEKPKRKVRA